MLKNVARTIVALTGVTAIVATFLDTAERAEINPLNFFGFFTMQSNIIMILVLCVLVVSGLRRAQPGRILTFARACATSYIVIVGIVYNTLLTGLEGGVSLAWANWVLHVALPIYAVIDWVMIRDRVALSWASFWGVAVYPIVWIIVVLVRGATDGWVPYPFLDPTAGYAAVGMYCVIISAAILGVGAVVWWVGRRWPAPADS